MNALLDYIKTNKIYNIYCLNTIFCRTHELRAVHSKVGSDNLLHLSRRKSNYIEDDDIHNDTTITILDEKLDVVSMAPPLAEKYTLKSALSLPIAEESPIIISELLVGKLITVSAYKQTYLISTKDSIHADNQIAPNVTTSVQEIFLDLIDSIDPYNGLDGLFNTNRGGINCKNFSYTFIISPHNGKFTDNFLDYDIYLVGLYNKDIHRFMKPEQIKSLCHQLNGASATYKIKQPTYKKIYSIDQLNTEINLVTKKYNTRGLYMLDESMNAGYIVIKSKDNINLKKYLRYYVSMYLYHNYVGIIQINAKTPKIGQLINDFFIKYKDSASDMYLKSVKCRTRRAFHERVCGHKAEIVLYALYNKKIEHLNELYKIFTTNKIIKMMIEEYGAEHIKNIIKEQKV